MPERCRCSVRAQTVSAAPRTHRPPPCGRHRLARIQNVQALLPLEFFPTSRTKNQTTEDAMIHRCAQLIAWLRRAIDPYSRALELAAGLKADLQRLRAHVVELRIGLAEARLAATLRRRPAR